MTKKPKGIKLALVTREFLKQGARVFLMHPLVPYPKSHIDGATEKQRTFTRKSWGLDLGGRGKDDLIADRFLEELRKGDTYTEGFRYGVVGWPHTKLRFFVSKGLFRFHIYANVDPPHAKDVKKKCRMIARDMTKAGFQAITCRNPN